MRKSAFFVAVMVLGGFVAEVQAQYIPQLTMQRRPTYGEQKRAQQRKWQREREAASQAQAEEQWAAKNPEAAQLKALRMEMAAQQRDMQIQQENAYWQNMQIQQRQTWIMREDGPGRYRLSPR